MKVELRDSLEFLYADSKVSRRPRRAVALDVARGGTAAVHILLNDLPAGAIVQLSLARAGAGPRPAPGAAQPDGVQWFRLIAVPVEKNTGLIGFTEDTNMEPGTTNRPNPYVARRAPFRVFDAMAPIRGSFRAGAAVAALRLHLPVGRRDATGLREYVIGIAAAGRREDLRLRVRVRAAAIPPVGRESFPFTNWFHLDRIAKFHNLRCWSAAHWRMIGRYARLMARVRQNTFLLQMSDIFTRAAAGLTLDRRRLRRIVGIFTSAGMHYIEGPHLAGHGKSPGNDRFVNRLDGPPATSEEGNADIALAARQLLDEIDRNGWRGRWLQHAADEPNDKSANDYRLLCGIIRRHMPGIPVIDATCSRQLAGSVDLWCPHVHLYQRHRDFYARQRACGDGVWYYTCCEPGGKWLNRLLDQELLRPAMLGWAAALFGLDGFLHWGLNSWQPNASPFDRSVEEHLGGHWPNSLPAGDTHIVYPGPAGPWSSVRLEAHREGFEDLELLGRLKARSPRAAASIIKRVLRAFDDYTTDVRRFRAARLSLLKALT